MILQKIDARLKELTRQDIRLAAVIIGVDYFKLLDSLLTSANVLHPDSDEHGAMVLELESKTHADSEILSAQASNPGARLHSCSERAIEGRQAK